MDGGNGRNLITYAILAAVVSLGLLLFAFAASDAHVTDVVVGAVTGFWLREATYIGRAVTTSAATPSPSDAAGPEPTPPPPAGPVG